MPVEQVAGKSAAGDVVGRTAGTEVALARATPPRCYATPQLKPHHTAGDSSIVVLCFIDVSLSVAVLLQIVYGCLLLILFCSSAARGGLNGIGSPFCDVSARLFALPDDSAPVPASMLLLGLTSTCPIDGEVHLHPDCVVPLLVILSTGSSLCTFVTSFFFTYDRPFGFQLLLSIEFD